MKAPKIQAAVSLLMVLAAGCTTMGTGYGSTSTGKNPVNFSWQSSDGGISGEMTATQSDGKVFTGQFFQITRNTTVDNLGPLWTGWGPRWRGAGWDYWDAGPEFVTHYTGKVVANLVAPDGMHMRCTFHLIHPSDSMAGGGEGSCQRPDRKAIEATFPRT